MQLIKAVQLTKLSDGIDAEHNRVKISFSDSVSAEDIVRIGERMLAGRPSLVGYGDIGKLAVSVSRAFSPEY